MPFTCITDHASFKWLMSMKDLSGRLARWSECGAEFDKLTKESKPPNLRILYGFSRD